MVSAVTFAPGCLHGCDNKPSPFPRRSWLADDGENSNGLIVRDSLSLSSFHLQINDDGSYEQTGLRLSSRATVRTGEDGQLSVQSDSRLKFRYEFANADGTKISVRAKANLQFGYRSDGSIDMESLKLNVKFGVSVIQQNVSDGLNPLADGLNLPEDAKNAIAAATDLFQQVSDQITSAFTNADAPDGDALIKSLVNAFNELTGSLSGIAFPPQPALPGETDSTGDSSPPGELGLPAPPSDGVPGEVVAETAQPVDVPQPPGDSLSPTDVANASLITNVEPLQPPAAAEENEPVAEQVAEQPVANPAVADEPVAPQAVADPPVADVPAEQSPVPTPASPTPDDHRTLLGRALLDLRVRVTASLQSLTKLFGDGTDASTLFATRLDLHASVRLSATYYDTNALADNTATPPAGINVQA